MNFKETDFSVSFYFAINVERSSFLNHLVYVETDNISIDFRLAINKILVKNEVVLRTKRRSGDGDRT